MRPELRRVGEGRHPVVVADDFSGRVDAVLDLAAARAPFPPAGNYYPGLRSLIAPGDSAFAYVETLLEAAAPLIGGAFDAGRFDLVEASFSMVTADPARLSPAQRAPHFDTTDPDHIAVLHYLSDTPGTAFFRQRATGIERVDDGNVDAFVEAARGIAPRLSGYIQGSGDDYEEIARVEGVRDRLILYQGALLHSGIIPAGLDRSGDPRRGRLTANIFLRCHR